MEQKQTLSPAEFARAARLTMQHVYALLAAGRLQAEKRDGRWHIAAAELEKRQRRKQPSPPRISPEQAQDIRERVEVKLHAIPEMEAIGKRLAVRDPEAEDLDAAVEAAIERAGITGAV